MGSKLGRLNFKFGGSWELCSRIWESRDSNLNRVTGYSDRIFVCYFLHFRKPIVGYYPQYTTTGPPNLHLCATHNQFSTQFHSI